MMKLKLKEIVTTLLMSLFCVAAFAQKTVTGTVVDATGEPVIGASIMAGGGRGTVTDYTGGFTLADVSDQTELTVSYVGYLTQTVRVGSQSRLHVVMKEDTKVLDELVVVGYGTQKKVNLTGAVSSISADELAGKPVMSTAQALAGLAPGLSVLQNSGRPGAGAVVKIRGTGTFSSAGNDPLVLIDGLAGSIDDVDPGDVQSISFLKDAASASIYGNRAANGVILIETKKGTEGKVTISYNNSFGWQHATELPDFLPSWEYATYYNMAMRNMGRQEAYSAEQIEKFRNGSDPDNYPNVNHLKWMLETGSGFQHQHNVSVQGGSATTKFHLSVGYRHQDGLTAETSNERVTALLSLNNQLTRRLTMSVNLNAYYNRYKAPNGEPASVDGMIGYAVREGPVYAGRKSDGSFGFQDSYSPEAWLASESFVDNTGKNLSASGQLVWDTPLTGLKLTGKAGVTFYNGYDKSFRANTHFSEEKTVGPASLSMGSADNTYTTLEGLVTYERNVAGHGFRLLAGSSAERASNKYLNAGRNTFPNNSLYELSAGSSATASNGSSTSEWALMSFFGRINYSYKDRYLLEGNLRYDGSSRFADGHRWGLFPSVSAGWRITEENFWKNLSLNAVDNLKLRLSYGVLGNQNIGVYPYQQTYSLGHDTPLGNPATLQSGVYMASYNNPGITWEKTAITDVGIDFAFFKSTLTGTIDYFYKYTSDILAPVEVSSLIGRQVGQSNVGAVSNKGIELTLAYNGKIGKDFRFSVSPNFTWVKNAVEKLSNGAKEEINNNRIVGQPLGIIYGYQTEGLFVDQPEIDAAPEQLVGKSNLKPGYIRYKDLDGDEHVDANHDRKVLGSTTPRFYYGMTVTAGYKGFDLSMLVQGLGGHKRLIGSYMAYAFYNGGQIQRWQADNCWTEERPDKWAEYPRMETLNMNNANLQVSDYWIRDASFLRLKNLQLGYTLPKAIVSRMGIESLRVFVSGQNLLTLNGFYKGWDPENEIGTGDAPSYYPINSIYSFGLNVKF